MVLLSSIPNITLKALLKKDSLSLQEAVGNKDTEIIVWRVGCPHCKTLLSLLDRDESVKRLTINIDDKPTPKIKGIAENLESMDHYHVDEVNKKVLLSHFNIKYVPFTKVVEVDMFSFKFD